MKISTYHKLSKRLEKADLIMSDIYEVNLWIGHFKQVINKEPDSVYVRATDKRRKPTPEEVEKASSDLVLYTQKLQALEAAFAGL